MAVKSLKTEAAYVMAGRMMAFAVLSISPIILARLLSVEQFGSYRQILLVSSVVLVLMRCRIPQSLYYFFPRMKDELKKLFSQSVSILFVLSGLSALGFYMMGTYSSFLPAGIRNEYILTIAIYLFLEGIAHILDQVFILEKKSKVFAILNVIQNSLRLVLIVGAILAFKTVLAIIYALILFSFCRFCVLLIYLIKTYKIQFMKFERLFFKEQCVYVIPLAIGGVVGVLGNYFEKGLISKIMTVQDFAVYSVGGLGIMTAVSFLYTSIGDVLMPRFGELYEEKKILDLVELWHKMILINAMFTIPVALFCFFYADPIITLLFTDKYALAADVWRVNIMILFIQMTGYGYIPRAIGKSKEIMKANIVKAVAIIPLAFFFINKLGIVGGAVSFVISFWLNGLFQLNTIRGALKLNYQAFLPWGKLSFIFIISILILLISSSFNLLIASSKIEIIMFEAVSYFILIAIAFYLLYFMGILPNVGISKILRRHDS